MVDARPFARAMGYPRFNGEVYSPGEDDARLSRQIERVFVCMQDERWLTLSEISTATGDPPASVSAQLRHLRKTRFGSYLVSKRPRGERCDGLWEYQLGNPDYRLTVGDEHNDQRFVF